MPLRAGLVGAGHIGRFHVQALRRLKGVDVVGVTDVDPERARQFGEQHSLKVYGSVAALRDAGANVMHVLTPPAAHAGIAIEALESGCDIFVEKPLATSAEDCDRIARAADASGRTVCVGHSLLYDPFIRRALALVRAGAVGDVIALDYHRSSNQQAYPGAGPTAEHRRGGFPFRDLGIHALYLAEAFVGPLVSVDGRPAASGRGDVNLWVDEWHVMAQCERGTAHLHLSWNVRPQQNTIVVHGTRGILRADLFGLSVTVKRQRPLPEHANRLLNALGEGGSMAFQAVKGVGRIATGRLRQFHGVQALVEEFYSRLAAGLPAPVTPAEARRAVFWTEHVARIGDDVKDAWVERTTAARVPATTLVTGAGGYIGSQLVRRLVQGGEPVRVLLRRNPPAHLAGEPLVEIVLGDLSDPACVDRATQGMRHVYHVGAAMRGGAADFDRGTVAGTRNVIDSCLRHGVDRLIYMSSLAVIDADAGRDGTPISERSALERDVVNRGHYTRSKLEAEALVTRAVRERGLRAVLLRPGEVVGSDKPLLTPGVAQRAPGALVVLGSGRVRLPLVHVSDVVDAAIVSARAMVAHGSVFQLVDDSSITQNDIIAHYLTTTGDRRRVIRVPLFIVLALATAIEALGKRILGWAPIGPRRIRAATTSRTFDCSLAAEQLGWTPRAGVRSAFATGSREQSQARAAAGVEPAREGVAAV